MIGLTFIFWLLSVLAFGYVILIIGQSLKQRTTPQPDEVTMQLIGPSAVDVVERARMTAPVKNTHWHRHTFERPRRKVK